MTSIDTPTRTKADLGEEAQAIMDRAVRASREQYWCDIFDRFAGPIFGVAANEVVDSDGFSCRGYNAKGFNAKGFNRDGYNEAGFNSQGYNAKGYDSEGYDKLGFNAEGIHRDGGDRYRYDVDGYDPEGYDSTGRRYRGNRAWYTAQAAKPTEDFRYDQHGYPRPAEKKTVKQRLGL